MTQYQTLRAAIASAQSERMNVLETRQDDQGNQARIIIYGKGYDAVFSDQSYFRDLRRSPSDPLSSPEYATIDDLEKRLTGIAQFWMRYGGNIVIDPVWYVAPYRLDRPSIFTFSEPDRGEYERMRDQAVACLAEHEDEMRDIMRRKKGRADLTYETILYTIISEYVSEDQDALIAACEGIGATFHPQFLSGKISIGDDDGDQCEYLRDVLDSLIGVFHDVINGYHHGDPPLVFSDMQDGGRYHTVIVNIRDYFRWKREQGKDK